MTSSHSQLLSESLTYNRKDIEATISLLEDGASIPFIARYRKERTGGLDEVAIEGIKQEWEKLLELEKRKETVLNTLKELGKLSPELERAVKNCTHSTELEDLYLPYKPKRKTRASIAREKGLEELAYQIMGGYNGNILALAKRFVNPDVLDIEEAIQGAKDIIAEWVSENQAARNTIRRLYQKEAELKSTIKKKLTENEAIKYKDYWEYRQELRKIPSHRLLAIRRGEKEGFLSMAITVDKDRACKLLEKIFIRHQTESSGFLQQAIADSFSRLLAPSISTEFAQASKEKADQEAIRVFASNLEQLLMAPPLGKKRVLAIDPGFRTGCKLVCLDELGNLLHNETIYPHAPQKQTIQASKKVSTLIESYGLDAIAIGNGTASRETESFIKKMKFSRTIQVFIVSEDGASVYSASSIAREEFPQYDVTVRGAISIGRRLMDPLAELVKIDPKSIGVGQYQHDVDQNQLKASLVQTVINTVNRIGVDVNTASKHLLAYVSGLGPQLAENLIQYRNEQGGIHSRSDLMNIPRMGKKSFEQAAGFLRILNAQNPLDATAVHPESYEIVENMAKDLNAGIKELLSNSALRKEIVLEKYLSSKTGLPTLKDILNELEKPGRDPRKPAKVFEFDRSIYKIEDLIPGMIVPGIVNNITNFGVFVDIGIKESGLIHISQLKEEYVGNPAEVVQLHEHLMVKVIDIDISRKRIQLSLKGLKD